jgi:hypothetical protein
LVSGIVGLALLFIAGIGSVIAGAVAVILGMIALIHVGNLKLPAQDEMPEDDRVARLAVATVRKNRWKAWGGMALGPVAAGLWMLLASFPGCGASRHKLPGLAGELEGVLAEMDAAYRCGDQAALAKALSSRRYADLHNATVSMLKPFDAKVIKEISEEPLALSSYRFVKLLENGDTAGLVYVRDETKVEQGPDAEPGVVFLVCRFVREGGRWRSDAMGRVHARKFTRDEKETDYVPHKGASELAIDGLVHQAPPLCPMPDYRAQISQMCYGYRVKMTVNGVEQHLSDGGGGEGLLLGGLRAGENRVRIEALPQEGARLKRLEVEVTAVLSDGKDKKVFSYKPPEGQVPPVHEAVIPMPPRAK